jgi:hypothetical protein
LSAKTVLAPLRMSGSDKTSIPEPPLARWERELLEMLRVLRKTDKPLILIVKWDGLAWLFQECKPPIRVPEK